jgi:alpha-1,6-mannosyltransferase
MKQKVSNKFSILSIITICIFITGLVNLAYFTKDRADTLKIWICLGFMFLGYFYILYKQNNPENKCHNNFLAYASRLILIFSFPLLSDDIYRFIWDGSQILNGINPFSFTPTELITKNLDWVDPLLFQKMNSPNYYSVYPPINQIAFLISAIPGKGNLLFSTVLLRVIILAFDIGNIYLIKKLLKFFQKDEKLVFWYALNPLVILEFTGNLHFEAVMILFTLLSIWFLLKYKWLLAGFALGLAVCSKLLPLIFLPLFIKHIGWKKTIYAGIICLLTVVVFFLPFIYNLQLIENFFSSIKLYYGRFEFNGSVYQILNACGWKILGYNPIAYTSKILLVLTLIGFIITYIKSKNMFEGIFWLIFIYTIFGAIVHPWYILILIAFTPFLKWRFAILWSILICLSYYTYHVYPYQENIYLVCIEYTLLALFIIYEIYLKYNPKITGSELEINPNIRI